jgi:hypothetical protein
MKKMVAVMALSLALGVVIGVFVTSYVFTFGSEKRVIMADDRLGVYMPLGVYTLALFDTRRFVEKLVEQEHMKPIVWDIKPDVTGTSYTLEVEGKNLGDIPQRVSAYFDRAVGKYREKFAGIDSEPES